MRFDFDEHINMHKENLHLCIKSTLSINKCVFLQNEKTRVHEIVQ